jgi:hypothetical protein
MGIIIGVRQVRKDKPDEVWPEHEFLMVPRTGDIVQRLEPWGVDMFRVVNVVHRPLVVTGRLPEEPGPSVKLDVEYVGCDRFDV